MPHRWRYRTENRDSTMDHLGRKRSQKKENTKKKKKKKTVKTKAKREQGQGGRRTNKKEGEVYQGKSGRQWARCWGICSFGARRWTWWRLRPPWIRPLTQTLPYCRQPWRKRAGGKKKKEPLILRSTHLVIADIYRKSDDDGLGTAFLPGPGGQEIV